MFPEKDHRPRTHPGSDCETIFNFPEEMVVARINGERTATALRAEICLNAGIWVDSSLDAFADLPLLENYAACLAKLDHYKNVLLDSGIHEIAGTYDASHIDLQTGILYISYWDFTPDGIARILNACLARGVSQMQKTHAAVQHAVPGAPCARQETPPRQQPYSLPGRRMSTAEPVAGQPESSVVQEMARRRIATMQKLVSRLWPGRNFTIRAANSKESMGVPHTTHFHIFDKDGQYAGVTLVASPRLFVVEARRMERTETGWRCVQRKEYRV